MQLLTFRIEPGQEVIAVLKEEFEKRGLKDGAIVSVIGAVDECCISNMPQHNAKEDILSEFHQPLELSGTGEIRDGEPHIHCTISGENNETHHGHLQWAKVDEWYVSVFVITN